MTQDDPVIQRVREVRRKIAAECDFDLHKLYLWAKEQEAKLGDRVVHFEHGIRSGTEPNRYENDG